jgi:signal transduction histidine kinase
MYLADFGDDDGFKLILDKNMCVVDPIELDILKCGVIKDGSILDIEDFCDEDPRPEIVLSRRDTIYIADASLNIRGVMARGSDGTFSKVEYFETPFGDHYLLALAFIGGEKPASVLDVYRVEITSGSGLLPVEAFPTELYLGLLIGFLVGGGVCYTVMRRKRPQVRRKPSQTAQYNNMLTSLVNFNHGHMAGKNLNRLLFLFSNLPETREKLEEIKPNLKSAIEAYQSFTAAQLQSIIDNARELSPIKGLIKYLDKQSRLLSDQVENISVADLDTGQVAGFRMTVPEIIKSLKEAIGKVRSYLQTHFSANLLRVIPDVLSAVAGQFQQQGVGFSEITTRGGTAALLFFDESELAAIFEELLSNACDAMKDSEKKDLTLDIRFDEDNVSIKLSDTGRGLQSSDPDQVFNRNYSTSGTDRGYGLYHARQQVERFGGRIRIYNNENGPGTSVELILKTVTHE